MLRQLHTCCYVAWLVQLDYWPLNSTKLQHFIFIPVEMPGCEQSIGPLVAKQHFVFFFIHRVSSRCPYYKKITSSFNRLSTHHQHVFMNSEMVRFRCDRMRWRQHGFSKEDYNWHGSTWMRLWPWHTEKYNSLNHIDGTRHLNEEDIAIIRIHICKALWMKGINWFNCICRYCRGNNQKSDERRDNWVDQTLDDWKGYWVKWMFCRIDSSNLNSGN